MIETVISQKMFQNVVKISRTEQVYGYLVMELSFLKGTIQGFRAISKGKSKMKLIEMFQKLQLGLKLHIWVYFPSIYLYHVLW